MEKLNLVNTNPLELLGERIEQMKSSEGKVVIFYRSQHEILPILKAEKRAISSKNRLSVGDVIIFAETGNDTPQGKTGLIVIASVGYVEKLNSSEWLYSFSSKWGAFVAEPISLEDLLEDTEEPIEEAQGCISWTKLSNKVPVDKGIDILFKNPDKKTNAFWTGRIMHGDFYVVSHTERGFNYFFCGKPEDLPRNTEWVYLEV
ncbi:hypothetical protein D0962_23120 [Leptolyngbyaceae cyanobacterium CCMR0082]|uniref:Uncharacterized protein n=1 Tax=Adonisia turfae CCMR0082 TaxID=2304604 RepID=A0A6M0SD63_9CYAN|nr:hypothetical protein [Adonisia turfae]NEZ65612.1 hypothetical protein [Adonisia turfae CCMR0082]